MEGDHGRDEAGRQKDAQHRGQQPVPARIRALPLAPQQTGLGRLRGMGNGGTRLGQQLAAEKGCDGKAQHGHHDQPRSPPANGADQQDHQRRDDDLAPGVSQIGDGNGLTTPVLEPAAHRRHGDIAEPALPAKAQQEQRNPQNPQQRRPSHADRGRRCQPRQRHAVRHGAAPEHQARRRQGGHRVEAAPTAIRQTVLVLDEHRDKRDEPGLPKS